MGTDQETKGLDPETNDQAVRIKYSHKEMTENGGIFPIFEKLKAKGIPDLIKACLGERPKQSVYSYEDAITQWMATVYCTGYRLIRMEDTKDDIGFVQQIASHDTIGRIMKNLATKTRSYSSINPKNPKRGLKHYSENENYKLNQLLIKSVLQFGLINKNQSYTLDIDATVIKSKVRDASITYKGYLGFTPMVCMIHKFPVFISMRSGNATPHHKQLECLKDCIEMLRLNGIKISRVRIDGAGFKTQILNWLDSQGIKFIVSAPVNNSTKKVMAYNNSWEEEHLTVANGKLTFPVKVTERPYKMKCAHRSFRMIAVKITKEQYAVLPENWKRATKQGYRFVMTNDFQTDSIAIFSEYKQRGEIEQNFCSLKNDFGWKVMPFRDMAHNHVYMILNAFASNVYQGLLKEFSKKTKVIKEGMLLKSFRTIFIKIIASICRSEFTFHGKAKLAYEKL